MVEVAVRYDIGFGRQDVESELHEYDLEMETLVSRAVDLAALGSGFIEEMEARRRNPQTGSRIVLSMGQFSNKLGDLVKLTA